jgi:Ca-activated chloride channel family protein
MRSAAILRGSFFALTTFLAVSISRAQTPEPPMAHFRASVGTEYVSIPVVVRDRKGKFVDTLSRKDFHLWVDGSEVPLESFERNENSPVSFAILIDVSGSMGIGGKLDRARDAVRRLVHLRHAGDDFALFAFSEDQVRVVSEFSSDPADLLRQLFFLKAEGRTALFDAVIQTVNELLAGRNTKKAILLFTDGVDNASALSAADLDRVMQSESIPIFAIGLKNAAFEVLSAREKEDLSVAALERIAKASGGAEFLMGADDDLRPLADAIDGELRREYILGFEPSGGAEVRYHPLVVTVTGGGTRLVRSRAGYRGSAPNPSGVPGR